MTSWKTFAVLAVGTMGIGLAAPAPQSQAYLPPHGSGGTAPKTGKLEIAFAGPVMTVNGKKMTLPTDEKQLVAALGKPDRRADLANLILTWDDLGIFAYLRPDSTTCHAFAICLGKDSKEQLDFWPKRSFAGKLTVDGAELRNDSKIEDVNKAKTGKPFEADNVLTNVWSIDQKEGTLYLRRSSTAKEGFIKLELGIPAN